MNISQIIAKNNSVIEQVTTNKGRAGASLSGFGALECYWIRRISTWKAVFPLRKIAIVAGVRAVHIRVGPFTRTKRIVRVERMIFLPEAVLHNNESLDVLSRGRHLVQITKPLLLRYCSSPREYVRKEMKLFPSARHRLLASMTRHTRQYFHFTRGSRRK